MKWFLLYLLALFILLRFFTINPREDDHGS